MAAREVISAGNINYCMWSLKRQSNRNIIFHENGCRTLTYFNTALGSRGLSTLCQNVLLNVVNSSYITSSTPRSRMRIVIKNTLNKSVSSASILVATRPSIIARSLTAAKPLAATCIASHFLAGDLHVGLNGNAFCCQSRRGVSRASSQKSSTHFYDVLGLTPNATQHQIKSAYYKMSKLHHPDVTACAKSHALFTEINEAYETLGNLRKRRLYDRGVYNYKPGVARTDSAEAVVNEDENVYTEAYRKRSIFERGDRPPPPTGRSRIYNFDEFYKQHYGDLRHRRWNENIEYMKYKEEMEQIRKANEQKLLVPLLFGSFLLFSVCVWVVTSTDYDVHSISKLRSQSSASSRNNT